MSAFLACVSQTGPQATPKIIVLNRSLLASTSSAPTYGFLVDQTPRKSTVISAR